MLPPSIDRQCREPSVDAPVAHAREAQIRDPVYVVPIRDAVVPQLRRVTVQNFFDGRETCDEVGGVHYQRRILTTVNCSQRRPHDAWKCDRRAYKNVVTSQPAARS
jgi:hypothetical protein